MPIDRKALVERHCIRLTSPDAQSPLSVGNGEFAFTADITGLQSFPSFHLQGLEQIGALMQGIPVDPQLHSMQLGTQAQWGWHTMPDPVGYSLADTLTTYETAQGPVAYPDQYDGNFQPSVEQGAGRWLHVNPQRIDLGRLGLAFQPAESSERAVTITDLVEPVQILDLWQGLLDSSFHYDGQPVHVWTVCHPHQDLLAVRIESPLLATGRLNVQLSFAYASDNWLSAADWNAPERHNTHTQISAGYCSFVRMLDADQYYAALAWTGQAALKQTATHEYTLVPDTNVIECILAFSQVPLSSSLPSFEQTRQLAARHWEQFWTQSGAVDFSGSLDPRAPELERRVVLSQYLTAINCAGSLPPQETGLVCNSWGGKFHLEMHWWHSVHFLLWGRTPLFERSLSWYQRILPQARATARAQNYQGARWPKQVGPDGRESPSKIGPFLIWQQPHPIYYAELLWRNKQEQAVLEHYQELVFETAHFMASFVCQDGERYSLCAPLVPAQEVYWEQRASVTNPTFELAYWSWGLEVAQCWRERLGLPRDPVWEQVKTKLAHPTIREGVYTAIETSPYTLFNDHPSMLGAYGFVPQTPLIDVEVMRRTLHTVLQQWNWSSTWGWDYPLMAMCATRLGEPKMALDALLMDVPKNTYLANGHNQQVPTLLPLYLPGNGGLLTAIALMVAGWGECSNRKAPGFPADGSWMVQAEGIMPLP